ncbi:MAG: RDD family protein [Bradyrhizobium sp.]|uniref:RDD family protein n=1 Tax=Bradyrhizobium sp. TaxID=376 RepID=UPI001C28AC3B|nr:RDD family protein [Bradyrhizobium sp.]MBU6462174.1 RDD family protein [Pseudomonadota bacterium]MDE2067175.1 RDD family protein [Bradyrhizobium sp.]MDE2240898.1 RDD family protein [Bradyrhizobium sp.]MDE2470078.1 RDD family protein [Bradyrhizobium sp.]
MDAVASPPSLDVTTEPHRGGFWRRWLSAVIDIIIVTLPFSALAAILFSMTAGMVQMDSGLFSTCTLSKAVPAVALDPPPPHDSNFSRICHVWFFTAKTGGVLTVGRATRDGNVTTTVTQSYMIDRNDKPIHGYAIDWIASLALLAYLVVMIWKSGRSLGDRVVKLKVIDTTNPAARGVPLGKAFLRYPAMMIGFVPAFALLIWRIMVGGSADAMFTPDTFKWMAVTFSLAGVWIIVLIVQIARKRDPYYDRLAGTAVIRT